MRAVQRYFRCAVEAAEIRTAKLAGTEYVVVPVVMLVEGVVRPMGSAGPEFVPAEELAKVPAVWNHKPVVTDHPVEDGQPISASSPEVLEAMGFGLVFHATFADRALRAEAWLDPLRAAEIGEDAERVLADARRAAESGRLDEMFEVSIGAWITLVAERGEFNGEEYVGRWSDIRPDHLAAGLRGAKGACSVEMGCGGPRVNTGGLVDFGRGRSIVLHGSEPVLPIPSTTHQLRIATQEEEPMFDFRSPEARQAAEGLSDTDVRGLLEERLIAAEGEDVAWLYVEAVYDKTVVYQVHREGKPPQLYERSYDLDTGAEAVNIGDKRTAVRRKRTEYEPAATGARFADRFKAALGRIFNATAGDPTRVCLSDVIHLAGEDGASDDEVRRALDQALFAIEPAFLGTVKVFPDTSRVVYAVSPEGELIYYRRDFTVDDDGNVTLGEDREEVTPVTEFKPVAASQACGCGDPDECTCQPAPRHAARSHNPKESNMDNKLQEIVGRLIANEQTDFHDGQEETLAALGLETLEAMEARLEAATAPPDPPDPPAQPANTTAVPTDEWQRVKAAADAHDRNVKRQKAKAVTAIKAAPTNAWTDEQLESCDLDELGRRARALGLTDSSDEEFDYSSLGVPPAPDSRKPSEAPRGYSAALGRNLHTGESLKEPAN